MYSRDVCVVGGLGHVGLPLGLAFAMQGLQVVAYDINKGAIEKIRQGELPFLEQGGQETLRLVQGKTFHVSTDLQSIASARFVIIVIGTPVDEHLNPKFSLFKKFIDTFVEVLSDAQHIILRSTVYPGITAKVLRYLRGRGTQCSVSFCPGRSRIG